MNDELWTRVLQARAAGTFDWRLVTADPEALAPYLPLITGPWVVGQVGQSLDGRIATPSGHSHYINGGESLDHLHRLRALADAVVDGVGTVVADQPRLTVRRVAGDHPVRVVIDPRGRAPADNALLTDGVAPTIVVRRPGAEPLPDGEVEEIVIAPAPDGTLAPADIVQALYDRGLRRMLIEGGSKTLSAFLAAGCLNRLHMTIAPLLIGSGIPGISLPPIDTLDQALRPHTQFFPIGSEILADLDFG